MSFLNFIKGLGVKYPNIRKYLVISIILLIITVAYYMFVSDLLYSWYFPIGDTPAVGTFEYSFLGLLYWLSLFVAHLLFAFVIILIFQSGLREIIFNPIYEIFYKVSDWYKGLVELGKKTNDK